MKILLLIGTGSFLGGIFRYLLTHFVQSRFFSAFPLGTLTVNIIGCFFIGFIFGLSDKGGFSHEWKLFLTTGLLGGFTTFSAFSNETISLFRDGHFWFAIAYVSASVLLGLLATLAGHVATKII